MIPCKRRTRCCLFTEHSCAILLRHVPALWHAVTIPFGGALCNGDEVYHLCWWWQGITTVFISSKLTKIPSSHLYPEWTTPITAKLHFNLIAECIEKSLPFIEAGDKQQNSSGLNRSLAYFCGTSWLNCHDRRSMKLLCVFQRCMVALGYHVHCNQNKRTQRLYITLDSRYKVTVAEWPLWCFPIPIANRYTGTELSRTLGSHGLEKTVFHI